MEESSAYMRQLAREYADQIEPYLKYIPYFEGKSGKEVSQMYDGKDSGVENFAFPVFDQNVMNFVKEISKSKLMNRNYPYTYTRNGIRNHADELRFIDAATIRDWSNLTGILSKYVLGGQVKAGMWSEASEKGIFAAVLKKMKEITEYWGN